MVLFYLYNKVVNNIQTIKSGDIMYITREDAIGILRGMCSFERGLKSFFARYGYDLHENLGRRNILLSNAQEKETQKVLSKKYKSVISDGAPGKPDVVIEDIGVELECKLTSGSRSNGTLTYNLQTDWETICNKGQLDYNYIIANEEFTEFCYIIFEGLTPDDFHPPSTGARGKARMRKETAYPKAKFLVGSMTNNADIHLETIRSEIAERTDQNKARIAELNERLSNANPDTKKYHDILKMIDNETARYNKAIEKLRGRETHWENNCSYTFNLEDVEDKVTPKHVIFANKIYNVFNGSVFNDIKYFNSKDKWKTS